MRNASAAVLPTVTLIDVTDAFAVGSRSEPGSVDQENGPLRDGGVGNPESALLAAFNTPPAPIADRAASDCCQAPDSRDARKISRMHVCFSCGIFRPQYTTGSHGRRGSDARYHRFMRGKWLVAGVSAILVALAMGALSRLRH